MNSTVFFKSNPKNYCCIFFSIFFFTILIHKYKKIILKRKIAFNLQLGDRHTKVAFPMLMQLKVVLKHASNIQIQ